MTKDCLEKYPSICRALHVLERKNDFPDSKEELERQKQEIESFVRQIEGFDERSVVILRALNGFSWQQVSGQMEGAYSIDHLRRMYRETLKKYL